ncbi:hypothetical protein IEQ34_006358 [Dendrobium chrysotoxum]|uniref:Uncharacterized protein n=1 Tax=Dendrobium chrysotoxum TaxID=161865 RepID=A0AAV7HDM5_DENCH|nr:hypothetical protein IEQ34_006358 [Dendrobium chrysotoxum]
MQVGNSQPDTSVENRPLSIGQDFFLISGTNYAIYLDGRLLGSSCSCVCILNAPAQEPNATRNCTSVVCVNVSKDNSVNLEVVGDDF